jgi:hypothetical protein
MMFGISPESCSASPRNAVRLAPEYAAPILLEVQQREQEILEYLSRDLEQPVL